MSELSRRIERNPWLWTVLAASVVFLLISRVIDLALGADWGVWSWLALALHIIVAVYAVRGALNAWRKAR